MYAFYTKTLDRKLEKQEIEKEKKLNKSKDGFRGCWHCTYGSSLQWLKAFKYFILSNLLSLLFPETQLNVQVESRRFAPLDILFVNTKLVELIRFQSFSCIRHFYFVLVLLKRNYWNDIFLNLEWVAVGLDNGWEKSGTVLPSARLKK